MNGMLRLLVCLGGGQAGSTIWLHSSSYLIPHNLEFGIKKRDNSLVYCSIIRSLTLNRQQNQTFALEML